MIKSSATSSLLEELQILEYIATNTPTGLSKADQLRFVLLTAKRQHQLSTALRNLIGASDRLTAAIEGTTNQFDTRKGALMDATSAAEKALKDGAP